MGTLVIFVFASMVLSGGAGRLCALEGSQEGAHESARDGAQESALDRAQEGAQTEAQDRFSVHGRELARHRKDPVLPALIGRGGVPRVPLARRFSSPSCPRSGPVDSPVSPGPPPPAYSGPGVPSPAPRARAGTDDGATVFGFLPYWIDEEYYQRLDFSLLTHIAAFGVEVDPDGMLRDTHGWPWTALVERAHAHAVRVILTATLFGNTDVLALVGDDLHRQRFFHDIRDAMLEGDADGLNVDFEGSGSNGWPALMPDFMEELTDHLHAEIPGCEVSFAGPAVDWSHRFDFPRLAAGCDYIFIMGYAFAGSWSHATGPVAPLEGGSRNLTTTVTQDYGEVTRTTPEKLILGVPYYGCHWETTGPQAHASVTRFVRYLYFSATRRGARAHDSQWDTASSTPWYRYQDQGVWNQVWHEDSRSLTAKYQLALEHGLRGVGMWALGYEGDATEPWDVLAATVGRRETATVVAGWAAADAAGSGEDAVGASAAGENAGVEDAPGASTGGIAYFRLLANYPNPFNGGTVLSYRLARAGRVRLTLYDVLGRRVRQWRRIHDSGGLYHVRWEGLDDRGRAAASGIYLVEAAYAGRDGCPIVRTQRVTLMR